MSYKIIAYLADWTEWGVKDIDAKKLTHINYAFATIVEGRVAALMGNSRLKKIHLLKEIKVRNPYLKVLISIGGWGADGFSDAALTDDSRALFADSAVSFMKEHGMDGIDIDWEYPCSSAAGIVARSEDKQNFTLLLKKTRDRLNEEEKLNGKRYLLTAAVGAGQYFIDGTEMGVLQQYLDFINVMTYDFASGADKRTGHHANLYESRIIPGISGKKSVNLFMDQGIPASKLILGVAFYGRFWSGVGKQNNGLGQPGNPGMGNINNSYSNISANMVNKNGFTRYWDDDAKAPFLYNGDVFISYDDEESVAYKADYIREAGLGGAMFWEYSADKTSKLLRKLYDGLKDK